MRCQVPKMKASGVQIKNRLNDESLWINLEWRVDMLELLKVIAVSTIFGLAQYLIDWKGSTTRLGNWYRYCLFVWRNTVGMKKSQQNFRMWSLKEPRPFNLLWMEVECDMVSLPNNEMPVDSIPSSASPQR